MADPVPNIIGQLLIGWILADLVSGLVHWWEDRVARIDWPLVGPWIVAPNRLHHTDPLAFTRGTLLQRNLGAWLVVAVISLSWLAVGGLSVTWAAATAGGLLAAEAHRWAHLPAEAGQLVRVLQQTGALQSPKHHAGHHRAPSDRRYCALTDWLNPVLDELQVWARLEQLLERVGLTPNRGAA